MNLLPFVPVMVLTTVITGFAGIIVAIIKVWPKLKELSAVRLNDAIEAWKSIAKRHEDRIGVLERDNVELRQTIRINEAKCDEDIRVLRRQMLQLQESAVIMLKGATT